MPRPRVAIRCALFALVVAVGLLCGRAGAQTGATFTYQATQPGWNLIGFFPQGGTDLAGPLYTFRPGAHNYDTPTSFTPGAGYWAYFTDATAYFLRLGEAPSVSFTIPGGSCAMIGNPSHKASARVIGASRVYVYSTMLGNYIQENLIGIGRGAWACNDQTGSSIVTIEDDGDVVNPTWPDCCAPTPISNGGLARVVVHNDSPYPLIAAARLIDASGNAVIPAPSNSLLIGVNTACASCPEYAPGTRSGCSASATARTYNLTPGTYTVHLQSEGPSVPDLQVPQAFLQANTSYDACFFVEANRPQKNY